jgi:broad specificity phosphatase PhoE
MRHYTVRREEFSMIRPVFPLVILFRHGQTNDNAARRFQGHSPTPLNALGRDQARRAGEIVANLMGAFVSTGSRLGNCLTSDLPRASETAAAVSAVVQQRLGISLPFAQIEALREFNMGDLQSHTADEFDKKFPGVMPEFYRRYEANPYTATYPGPTGESRGMMATRLAPLVLAMNSLWRESGKPSDNPLAREGNELQKTTVDMHLWSAHGGTIDALLELMNANPHGNKHIIGNGDVIVIAPIDHMSQKQDSLSPREQFATSLGCDVRWRLLRHYQVGDNIAAKIDPTAKE